MNPVCVECRIELRVMVNGAVAVQMAAHAPMEMRRADVWHCPSCEAQVIIGFAAKPELSGFDPAFAARLESYKLDPSARVVEYWMNVRERGLGGAGLPEPMKQRMQEPAKV